MARLGDIAKINMGQSPESSSYNEHGDGLPFFQGNADFGLIHPETRVWCNAPTKIAHDGDILISVRAPIGALNMANMDCCIGRGLAALTVDKKRCSKEYLWYAIASKVEELKFKGTGSTFTAIGKDILANTDIPLPSMKQQRHIAAVLDKVSALISLRKQQLAKLDELVKARFVEMFGDIIVNNRKWPVALMENITSSRLGKMLDSKQQTGNHTYPYLANFNVQWFHFDLNKLNSMDFDEIDQAEFILKDGDLMVTEGGEVGRCAVWHSPISPCFFQKALHRIRCDNTKILPDYLSWWFKFHADYNSFEDVIGGVTSIAHLPGVKLKKLEVVVPSLELQHEFTSFIEQTDRAKLTIQRGLDKLETLKKSLMQEYFG